MANVIGLGHEQGEAIRLGQAVDIIGCDEGSRSRHGLDDHARIAGKIFRDKPGQQPSPAVIEPTRGGADDGANLFALVEWVGLGVSERPDDEKPNEQN